MNAEHNQFAFNGGMNLFNADSSLAENEYAIGINIRVRDNTVYPILNPHEFRYLPQGKRQGLYAVGSILIIFIDGQAYYKLSTGLVWYNVINLQLDSTVDYIYGCAVPTSFNNFTRLLETSGESNSGIKLGTTTNSGLPGAFVVQDGINQPWIIYPNGAARVLHTYTEWMLTDREYVPIGKQMMFFKGILYIVAPDNKSFYRSVSGRPLDFVVNIDASGFKGGDATTTSHSVDYNAITCITSLNNDSFLVATAFACYSITPNYDNQIFGEPTFDQASMISAGVVNQNSFIEILGDYAFIDYEGLKSFNAVSQVTMENKINVFSMLVSKLFAGIVQDVCCAATFDSSALFSLKTTYGYCILIYDLLAQKFVSIDITEAVQIKQFAVIYTESERKIYAITASKLFELFGDAESFATPVIFTRAFIATNSNSQKPLEQKSAQLTTFFSDSNSDSTVVAAEVVDEKQYSARISKQLRQTLNGILFPVAPPVFTNSNKILQAINFVFMETLRGYKVSYMITWYNDARLIGFSITAGAEKTISNNI